jgi:predicted DNA-binding antitoxin AbrB/MazE fold protein
MYRLRFGTLNAFKACFVCRLSSLPNNFATAAVKSNKDDYDWLGRYHGRMTRTASAVYENGVLRPSEPLPLKERQKVDVTISDTRNRAEAWLDHEYMAAIDAMDESAPTHRVHFQQTEA